MDLKSIIRLGIPSPQPYHIRSSDYVFDRLSINIYIPALGPSLVCVIFHLRLPLSVEFFFTLYRHNPSICMAETGEPSASRDVKTSTYVSDEDDQSSLSSSDTQQGVKGIEAISQTWTQWSLIAAYIG